MSLVANAPIVYVNEETPLNKFLPGREYDGYLAVTVVKPTIEKTSDAAGSVFSRGSSPGPISLREKFFEYTEIPDPRS